MIRTVVLSVMLALSAVTAAEAGPRQMAVSLAGLNLADPADAGRLEARIHDAAVTVCGPVEYPLSVNISAFVEARDQNSRCIAQAEAGASARVKALRLAAIAAARRVAAN